MYCPRCSQQFVNDIRFCSRCGMRLGLVAEIVANDGFAAPSAGQAIADQSPRQNGVRYGAKLMFAGLALLPPFFGLCFPVDNPSPLLVPATVFFGGLCLQVYSRLFGDDATTIGRDRRPYKPPVHAPAQAALLAPEQPPISAFDIRRANTSETVQPRSVTDHTTQFFEQ